MWDMTHLHAAIASRTCRRYQYGGGRRIHTRDMTHSYLCMWHYAFTYVTCLVSYYPSTRTWHIHIVGRQRDYFMYVIWYINMLGCDTGWQRLIGSPKLWIILHKRATKYRSLLREMTCEDEGSYEFSPPCSGVRRIHMCDLTHSRMWHDSFICVTRRIHMGDMTPSYVCMWDDVFIRVTWPFTWVMLLIHMCDTTHLYVWRETLWNVPVTHMDESGHTYEWVMSHIWMSHVTHMNESCHTDEW